MLTRGRIRFTPFLLFLCVLFVAPFSHAQSQPSAGPCPLLGPDVPAPTSPSTSNAIRLATKQLTNRLNAALDQAAASGLLDANTTSFGLNVYSIHEPASSLYTYFHNGRDFAHPVSGVAKVGEDTIFRIGSLSKLFTVYLYLMSVGDASWHDPITKYIPELAAYMATNAASLRSGDQIDTIQWDQITIGALAGQIAGVPREFAWGPNTDAQLYQLGGLPKVAPVHAAFCGSAESVMVPCNRSAFFADYLVQHPVEAPFRPRFTRTRRTSSSPTHSKI